MPWFFGERNGDFGAAPPAPPLVRVDYPADGPFKPATHYTYPPLDYYFYMSTDIQGGPWSLRLVQLARAKLPGQFYLGLFKTERASKARMQLVHRALTGGLTEPVKFVPYVNGAGTPGVQAFAGHGFYQVSNHWDRAKERQGGLQVEFGSITWGGMVALPDAYSFKEGKAIIQAHHQERIKLFQSEEADWRPKETMPEDYSAKPR